MVLWLLCEIAIAAMDLAEVLGAAIGLHLLFGIPLLVGVVLTAADTLFILWFTRFGIRNIEAFVIGLVTIIGVCFAIEIFLAKPNVGEILNGFIPRLTNESLYVAIGILGATVMPHNLYLHSALVQTRRIGITVREKRDACRFNFIDSVIALNGALFVNAAILILAATLFFKRGIVVTEIDQAHLLLAPLLGTAIASTLFATALLASGQSSTLTGTMAGQIVMEGFLNFRMRPWLRRLITRMLAVIPAVITIWTAGEQGSYQLLILSQVILSLQLPFAVIPLIHFTSDRRRMGEFSNRVWVRLLAWTTAAIIVGLNIRLVISTVSAWIDAAGPYRPFLTFGVVPLALVLLGLLAWVTFEPVLPALLRRGRAAAPMPEAAAPVIELPHYQRLLVPLDHSDGDRPALAHAAAIARQYGATIHLLHVEEDVTSQVYGSLADTAEVEHGRQYLEGIRSALAAQGVDVKTIVRYRVSPREEIIRVAEEIKPDLVVMGAHGHRGLKDLIFGTTISSVRHKLRVPLLVVTDEPRRSA
jgi:manganese transport protein